MEKIRQVDDKTVDDMVQAFLDFPYDPNEDSQFYLFKSREKTREYIKLVIKQGIQNGQMFTWKNRGYVILSDETTHFPLLPAIRLLIQVIRAMGLFNFIRYTSLCSKAGCSLESRYRAKNKPYIHIEMLVVLKPYQKQGIMRSMMDEISREALRQQKTVILETDCRAKARRYEHLGLTPLKPRQVTERFFWYDFTKAPSRRR